MSVRSEFEHLYKFKDYNGTYGIELECETKDSGAYPQGFFTDFIEAGHVRYKIPVEGWIGHSDNSLRNFGMEFVLEKPLHFENAIVALNAFKAGTKGIEFLSRTPSTSTHVHVNMLPEEVLTMANFMTIWTLFESVLVDFSGPTRKSNLFALPSRVAEANVHKMVTILQSFRSGNYNNISSPINHYKYAALNLVPLTAIGSLEIRSFRGETDIEEVKNWLKIINQLLEFSRISGMTPSRILEFYHEKELEFFDDVFDIFADTIRSKVDDIRPLIENHNLWYASQIADAVPDWENINTSLSEALVSKFGTKEVKKKRGHVEVLVAASMPDPHAGMVSLAQLAQAVNSHQTWGQPVWGPSVQIVTDEIDPLDNDPFAEIEEEDDDA